MCEGLRTKRLQTFGEVWHGDCAILDVKWRLLAIKATYDPKRDTLCVTLGQDLASSEIGEEEMGVVLTHDPDGKLISLEIPNVASLLCQGTEKGHLHALIPPANTSSEKRDQCSAIDPLEIHLGLGLVRLADPRKDGDLIVRLQIVRQEIAKKLGIVVPPIRVKDDLRLPPYQYRIRLRSVAIAQSELMPDHVLVMNPDGDGVEIEGVQTREPAFGLPAVWAKTALRSRTEELGYTVVDPGAVLATHLTELIASHAAELLTRQDVHGLIEAARDIAPCVVEELMQPIMTLGEVHRVLQCLLRERVSIRDLVTILEVLSDSTFKAMDVETITEDVRRSLARQICADHTDENGELWAVSLTPKLERELLETANSGESFLSDLTRVTAIACETASTVQPIVAAQHNPVVLTAPRVRRCFKQVIHGRHTPEIAVLSYEEIPPEVTVRLLGKVSAPSTLEADLVQKGE